MGDLIDFLCGYILALIFVGLPATIISDSIKAARKGYPGEKERKRRDREQKQLLRLLNQHDNRHH